MEVRHRDTELPQKMSKDDWAKLQETGHAKNFEVISESDEGFTPPEAEQTTAPATPAAKDSDKADKNKK